MPELKLFTVSQLHDWLSHNKAVEGLSEQIIAPSRAWAIIHNPYVKMDDYVSAAIYISGKPVAYTAAFPEYINDKRIWWFTTLWCDPSYQGQGFSFIVIGSLAEMYGEKCAWDRSGVPETVETFSHMGNNLVYTPRYFLRDKDIANSIKGRLALVRQNLIKRIKRAKYNPSKDTYELRYVTHVDDETYAFISRQKSNDLFLHTQEMLNWELQYPFMITSTVMNRVRTNMDFHSCCKKYHYIAVQVWKDCILIGFYILRQMDETLSVIYCYTDTDHRDVVFSSIVEHIHHLSINEFSTDLKTLADHVRKSYYFPKYEERQISFSPAADFVLPSKFQMQFGDGDCFA